MHRNRPNSVRVTCEVKVCYSDMVYKYIYSKGCSLYAEYVPLYIVLMTPIQKTLRLRLQIVTFIQFSVKLV